MKLIELEKTWPQRPGNDREYTSLARNIMRLAEQARLLAMERASAPPHFFEELS
ncbi:MAG: hypothetical protein MOB07_21840 [Acidobacteria bacterium]|nr:hypothetical protein [Acidobacteriota bacterium]